jgi:hypothetical protein
MANARLSVKRPF